MSSDPDRVRLRVAALASASLLSLLCAATLATGVSQQWFEWARPPATYASALVRDDVVLRAIVAVDDVFIPSYVAVAILFAVELAKRNGKRLFESPMLLLVAVLGVLAGVLDLEENHHLLAMLALARDRIELPLEEIVRRSDLSQLKWMLGHVAFALAGLAMPAPDRAMRAFRLSLVGWQLPIGALVWAMPPGPWLTLFVWLRYGALIGGFAVLSLPPMRLWRDARDVAPAVATGAPA